VREPAKEPRQRNGRAPVEKRDPGRRERRLDRVAFSLQRQAGNAAVGSLLDGVPLAGPTRYDMEQLYGFDFGSVRVHTGPAADAAARAEGALAYTFGTDLVFRGDAFAPQTSRGRRLLAHELAHVVQQSKVVSRPGESERDADRAADAALSGVPRAVVETGTGGPVLQRQTPHVHDRPAFEEQHAAFAQFPRSAGWTVIEGPSGRGGHGLTQAGLDALAFNNNTFELVILEQKGISRARRVGLGDSPTAVTVNLAQNLSATIQRVRAMQDLPNRMIILSKLQQTLNAVQSGTATVPLGVTLQISSERGTGITRGLRTYWGSRGVNLNTRFQNTGVGGAATGAMTPTTTTPASTTPAVTGGGQVGATGTTGQAVTPSSLSGAAQQPAKTAAKTAVTAERQVLTAEAYVEIFRAELDAAKKTGRLSERGIEALWELNPAAARRLVASSGLSRSERARVMQSLPGQAAGAKARGGAGAMLALQLAMEAMPIIQAEQARANERDVMVGARNVDWWIGKGVVPKVEARIDKVWPEENATVTDLDSIRDALRTDDVHYLALTHVDEEQIDSDAFWVWATTHLVTYRDWEHLIIEPGAVRMTKTGFEYRVGVPSDGVFDFDVDEDWKPSPALTKVLTRMWHAMAATTAEEVESRAGEPGTADQMRIESTRAYSPQEIYGYLPQAIGTRRFRPNLKRRRLFRIPYPSTGWIEGFRPESRFHVFPPSAIKQEVDEDFVLVGGADFDTYREIYASNSLARRGLRELMLAEVEDLEDPDLAPTGR
jgi:hypothetical protein